MSILGPMVVIADHPASDLLEILGQAGAFPIVEATWFDAPAAIAEITPGALAIAEPGGPSDPDLIAAIAHQIASVDGPFMPVIARVTDDTAMPPLGALPVEIYEPTDVLVARLRSALRVRTLHATLMRRAEATGLPDEFAPPVLSDDLLTDATVLCVGRGRSYPELSVCFGERVGVVGALGIEAAAQCLSARDIDGIVIGEGFSPRVTSALLTAVAEDGRFRDLPIGLLGDIDTADVEDELPNLVRVPGSPRDLLHRLLPFIRLQALESQLKRLLKSFEASGLVDPATGLLRREAFWQDLERAAAHATDNGSSLSVARISFDKPIDRRSYTDAARLLARLVRDVDVACQDEDGSILVGFTETDLRMAHVVVRRIASVLKHTMVAPDGDRRGISPTVTLATLKPKDNLFTMMSRISAFPDSAAG